MIDVIEVHIDGTDLDNRSRDLRAEMKRDPLVRLYVDLDPVSPQTIDGCIAEQDKRCLVELDGDARVSLAHPFSGSQIEGNIGPAPVVDRDPHRRKGFGI